jgi:hypothetical protein
VEWQARATGDEVSMGDHNDFPFDLYEEKKMQQHNRLQEKS